MSKSLSNMRGVYYELKEAEGGDDGRAEVEAALASPEPQAETRTYYYPMYAGGWTGGERYDSLDDAQTEEAHHLGSTVVAFLSVTCINDRPVAVALEDADGY